MLSFFLPLLPLAPAGALDAAPCAHGRVVSFLPAGITSFGAVACGDRLYVLGGYSGTPHAYSREGQSGAFLSFDLANPAEPTELPGVEPLQSVALVAHEGTLVRVGGMRALNVAGEPAELVSLDEVARFDPATLAWTALPSLPEPRSSHDAVVVGSRLVVAGGWTLGGAEAVFASDVLVLDLDAPDQGWLRVPAPFRARALAVAALPDGVAVIGGLEPKVEGAARGTERCPVRRLDLSSLDDGAGATWHDAPDFPSDGFGIAATAVEGSIVASSRDGCVHAWTPGDDRWREVGRLTFGRFFHRLVATSDARVVAVGGIAGMDGSGRIRAIESLALAARPDPCGPVFTAALPGAPRNRQGAYLAGTTLHLFGGNAALGQHDFSPASFAREGLRFDLGSHATRALAEFPVARQAMEAASLGAGREALVGGGFGHDGEVARSHAETFLYDAEFDSWRPGPRLDRPRSQFALVAYDGDVYALGGHDYDPRRVEDEAFEFPMAVVVCDAKEPGAKFDDTGLRLPRGRRAFGYAELDGSVYLVGGMGPGFEMVDVVDVLDLDRGRWSTVAAPLTRRVGASLVALEGRLYLVGGTAIGESDRAKPMRSIEVFDPATGAWSVHVAELPIDPRHARATTLGASLLVWSTRTEGDARIEMCFVSPVADAAVEARQRLSTAR